MVVKTPFCRNQKAKTKQHKIVGGFMKHLTKIKHVLNTNQAAIKQQKKRYTFPRHQKAEIKQQKTKQTFLTHATGKVQQPMTTKIFRIKKMQKKIQGQQLSHRQTSTTEDHTKISHIEGRKETAQGQYHLTGKVPQPKTK